MLIHIIHYIGVPLFAFTIGHIAGYIVSSINYYHRKQLYRLKNKQLSSITGNSNTNTNNSIMYEQHQAGDIIQYYSLIPGIENNLTSSKKGHNYDLFPNQTVSTDLGDVSTHNNSNNESNSNKEATDSVYNTHINNSHSIDLPPPGILTHTAITGTHEHMSENLFYAKSHNYDPFLRFRQYQQALETSDNIHACILRELLINDKIHMTDLHTTFHTWNASGNDNKGRLDVYQLDSINSPKSGSGGHNSDLQSNSYYCNSKVSDCLPCYNKRDRDRVYDNNDNNYNILCSNNNNNSNPTSPTTTPIRYSLGQVFKDVKRLLLPILVLVLVAFGVLVIWHNYDTLRKLKLPLVR